MSEVKNTLISVVLLCYNNEKFVAEAVDGVLAQSYSPLDIIIVDDCSTDRTANVIMSKLSTCPNRADVRFIRNPQNMTWWGACERALNMAQGSFIVLSCGDDVMLPNMVEHMADVWKKENVSLITANVQYIDEQSNSLGRTARDCDIPADDSFETLARDGGNACCFGASMGFAREVYSTFGLPPSYLGAVDIMLPFFAYLLNGARFVPTPLLKYRVHGTNASLSLSAEKSSGVELLLTEERIFHNHIAHAFCMRNELNRLSLTMPTRYRELAEKIGPLLTIQFIEMHKKLTSVRAKLQEICS